MKNTLYFAICDDEKIITQHVKDKLEQLLQEIEIINYQIDIYYNGRELIKSKKSYNLLLLDIEMPEMDGFSVAKEINQLTKRPLIIFLTSHRKFMSKGYHVKAFRYLVKPVQDDELQEAVLSAIKEITTFQGVIVKRDDRSKEIINVNEIMYIEALGEGCSLHMGNYSFIKKEPLKYWKKTLPKDLFIQTHKSYLVNLKYMKKIGHNTLTVSCDHEIPIAARRKTAVSDAAHAFARTKGRG